MKNFNIFGGLLKNLTFKVGLHEKPIYRGVLPKKGGGHRQFAGLRGRLARMRGWCFGRGLIPQCTL